MPTNKPHFSIVMDEHLLRLVEDFQKENGIRSRGKAINVLLKAGIAATLEDTKKAAPSADTDEAAGEELPDTAEAIAQTLSRLGVIRPGGDIRDQDRRFLEAMFDALKAHFQK